MASPDKVFIDIDAANELRWTRKSSNGRIIADSSEGYKNVSDCIDMAFRVNGPSVEYFVYKVPYVLSDDLLNKYIGE